MSKRSWPRMLWWLGSIFCLMTGYHRPSRVLWNGYWSGGWRCLTCGATADTAEELMGLGAGYVHQKRPSGNRGGVGGGE